MGKDRRDDKTIDMLGGKPGRPVINPDFGPMNDQERQARYRAGRKSVQILLSEKNKDKLFKYCTRHEITHHQLITNVIKSLKLTKPGFLG